MSINTTRSISECFDPGFKVKPAVCIGSQSINLFEGISYEQAWEGYHLAEAEGNDVVVVRYMDDNYLDYWQKLVGVVNVINLKKVDRREFLSDVILKNNSIIAEIKKSISLDSRLTVFLPTRREETLAKALGIPLHGSSKNSLRFGTKSGIRKFAEEIGLTMPPGIVCRDSQEVYDAICKLGGKYKSLIVKHDMSLSGYFSKKIDINGDINVKRILDEISGGIYREEKDIVVVEAWIENKCVLCAHIEILQDSGPVVCSAWQQIIDDDGLSYIGAGPLNLSDEAFKTLVSSAKKLASELHKRGINGSFGPDYVVTSDNEPYLDPDTSILIELNARIPYTAFPLEIVKKVKGRVDSGFLARHIKLPRHLSYFKVNEILNKEKLLIQKQDAHAKGVVPFNVGMLPWKLFSIVIMADSWDECREINYKIENIFKKL